MEVLAQDLVTEVTHLWLVDREVRAERTTFALRVEQPDVLGRGDRVGGCEAGGGGSKWDTRRVA